MKTRQGRQFTLTSLEVVVGDAWGMRAGEIIEWKRIIRYTHTQSLQLQVRAN